MMDRKIVRSVANRICARLERVKDERSGLPETARIADLATATQDVLDMLMEMMDALPE